MTSDEFLRCLRSGHAVHCIYRAGDLVGMIAIYPHNEVFVLHREECRDEDQRNSRANLRDEMHRFESAEEVLTFVEQAGYPAAGFSP
jgi:hypothetical protein